MEFKKFLTLGALLLATQSVCAQGVQANPAEVPVVKSSQAAARELNQADLDAWLDGYMPFALHAGDIPGAVVVVVKDGKILSSRGYGYANVEKRQPVDPDSTLFRPGSISKLVTWTAVMQQVEQKKLDLDADVNTYLDFKIPPRAGAPVTLRQIMTHTAGFEEATKNIIHYDSARVQKLGDLLKAWIPTRIFDAGTTPGYSNYATALAGYIVERVSGETFDDYVERHIFKPMGMRTASFRQPLPAALQGLVSEGYAKPGKAPAGFEIVGPAPAGSLSASGTDMGRFMIANLQHGEIDGNRIMKPETADLMHNSPIDSMLPSSVIAPLNRMELGFFETNINGRGVIGHLGDTVAFHSSLHLFMKEGVGFYVSFNSQGKAGAAGILRTAIFQDFSDRYLPNIAAPEGRVDPKLAAEHARMMVGLWENSRRSESNFFSILGFLGQTKIDVNAKGELVVPALLGPNGRPREWVEIAPFVWKDVNGHDRLAAKVVDGKPVRWSMDFMSPFMMFDRVPASKSGAWLKPSLYLALSVLALTFLAAPIGWIARRKYNLSLNLSGSARKAYFGSIVTSGLSVLIMAGWMMTFTTILGNLKYATAMIDPWLWTMQILGVIVFVLNIAYSVWNLKLVWTDGRNRSRKLWSVLLLLSSLIVFYTALSLGLIAMTVNF